MARIKLQFVNGFVDRYGKPRFYVRRPGSKSVPLPGLPGSAEFMAAYEAALTSLTLPVPVGIGRTLAGTINALVTAYYVSSEFTGLAPETKRVRRVRIEGFRKAHGDKRLVHLQCGHIQKILASIDKAHARKNWLKAIRPMLQFAVSIGMRADDPTAGIKCKVPKSDGYHCWSDEEITQYRAFWPLGTQARLALELALETTSRRGDVTRIGPQHVRNGYLHLRHSKNRADCTIPLTPELAAAINAMPAQHLTFLHSEKGAPRAPGTLGDIFRRWCDEAALPRRCSIHGLRKGGARRLAEAGCSVHEIKSVTGHKTLTEVERYTKAADNKRLADDAMAKLAEAQKRTSGYKLRDPRLQTTG